MRYQGLPTVIGSELTCDVKEYFSYQYLPIKMVGSSEVFIEPRLMIMKPIGVAICAFVGEYGLNQFINSYVYVTAKNKYITKGSGYNREGYHIDGFGTKDINYIWYNNNPTIFNSGEFYLSDDDQLSLKEMEEQALKHNEVTYPNNTLLKLDNTIVHKVAEVTEPCVRTFLKVSFSKDKYNLQGNSHNYMMKYDWEMKPRNKERNIPQV